MLASWTERLRAFIGVNFQMNAALGRLTTYRVGGPAKGLIQVSKLDELLLVKEAIGRLDVEVPLLVLGNGSNMLVSDRGFDGLVVKLQGSFEQLSVLSDGRAELGGAAMLPVAARKLAASGLSGFEWAVGVPGSFGGAVRMNAGGHGSEIASSLLKVTLLDLLDEEPPKEVKASELNLSYRHSCIRDDQIVLGGEVQLGYDADKKKLKEEISEIVRWRRENQPGGQNAGSVFVNPDSGKKAAQLIEELGLKGLRVRSAHVSMKHANFIQCDEGGSADDVYQLMVEIKQRVRELLGVELKTEIRLIGFEEDAL